MAVAGIGGIGGGINLSQLAEAYRAQVASAGSKATDAANVAATGSAPAQAAANRSADFASAIGNGLNQVENLDRTAAGKAIQAATGDLNDIHDYVIAATQAQVATELTTTVRNKALEAFNEIMRMPL